MKKHHKRKNNIGLDQGNFLGLFFFTFRDIFNVPKSTREQVDYKKTHYMLIRKMLKTKDFITNEGHF